MSRRHGLLAQAFDRTAGAPQVGGNAVRLLRDAAENYPAWLAAIAAAECYVYFENYIIRDDATGAMFAEALSARARAGVPVRLVYDWLGNRWGASRRLWRRLHEGGVEVRCHNPPRLASPVGWLERDHRKLLTVDGRVAYVSGLCVGEEWVGDPGNGIEPWRDTGVEIRGPALADVEASFAEVWASLGPPLPAGERLPREVIPPAGDVRVRIVASTPGAGALLRVDQLVAAAARRTLWLTDPYFMGIPSYVEALRAAARDGVDVRLLVPGASDNPLLRPLSRAGFAPLLEAGVRIFEWKGPMLHAKTAVADGHWARVGSTNLNIASWIGNHELDALVADDGFAGEMERMYENDLAQTTELVLRAGRARPDRLHPHWRGTHRVGPGEGSAGRAVTGAVRIGHAVSAAITERRALTQLGPKVLVSAGALLLALAAIALLWPRVVAVPLAALTVWLGAALLARAFAVARERRRAHSHVPPRTNPRRRA